MRKRSITLRPINKDKFLCAIYKKGIGLEDLSKTIGRGKNYIRQRVNEGSFPSYVVYAVEQATGLKYEDYKAEENREEPKIDEEQLVQPVNELRMICTLKDIEASIIGQLKGIGNGQDSISVDTTVTWHLLKESLEVYKNMNQVLERMDKGQRVQMEHFKKMNETLEQMNENLESILKKTIGLEEVVYKGTKRALNE